MNKNIQASGILFVYLVTTAIGGLTIVHSKWNEYQIFVGVCFISLVFFLLINKNGIQFCYKVVKDSPGICIRFCIYLALMFMPIYLTQKHGVSTVFYCTNFSVVLSILGFINTKQYWRGGVFLVILLLILTHHKFGIFYLISIIGPVSCYFMLQTSKLIAMKTGGSTNKLMCLRYFLLAIGSGLVLPFLHFNMDLFTTAEITKIVLMAFFMNIIPIYCGQAITLMISANFLAKGAGFLPITVCFIAMVFYSRQIDQLEFILSLVIAMPVAIYLLGWLRTALIKKTL